MGKKARTPRISRQSQKRIETALKTGDLSKLNDQELCQAWLEAYSSFSDAGLLAVADNISLQAAVGRLRGLAMRAGLSAAEADNVAQGRIENLSDGALDQLIAAIEN